MAQDSKESACNPRDLGSTPGSGGSPEEGCGFPLLYSCSFHVDREQSPSKEPRGFPDGSDGKESARNPRDLGLIPESERSSGEGNGNPLQCSCLENPMNRGA